MIFSLKNIKNIYSNTAVKITILKEALNTDDTCNIDHALVVLAF